MLTIKQHIKTDSTAVNDSDCFFHPREIAFCGFSGTGKTTLITRLIQELSLLYSIGYVKHDSHRFDMDIAGKDTFEARRNGAGTVFINDPDHWAIVSNGAPSADILRAIYSQHEMVFVEGYKESAMRKIIVIDDQDTIMEPIHRGKISSVILYVGKRDSYSGLNATYFHRDNIPAIKNHILTTLGLDVE